MSLISMRSLLLVVLFAFLPIVSGGDWPQWRGSDENGISAERLPAKPDFTTVLWQKKVGTGFSTVVVAEGRVFTLGHSGAKDGGNETVWCFHSETGAELWQHSYPAPLIARFYEGGPGATPTVRGGKVFTYSKHGRLHCYEAATGKVIWQRDMLAEAGLDEPPEWGFACSPYFLTDDTLLIEAGATFALDAATGKVRWKSQRFTPAYGTPKAFTAGGRKLIAVMKTEGLVVLDAGNGATVATVDWKTSFDTTATTPIIHGTKIFISTGYDRGCAVFELAGDQLKKSYEHKLLSNHMNNSVLIDGHLYGFDGTAHRGRPTEFVCLELATGKEKWRVPPAVGLGCGSVMATADGTLLILSERGELLTAPATTAGFKTTARHQVLGGRCWTVPVLAHGRIYCRNARGDLVCVKAGDGALKVER
ncbi:MAG: alcohol dehydrogenase [Pedosphaera sp.]|nr:MAG: alcohol dehydrogenase [Pedosphaera sp.]